MSLYLERAVMLNALLITHSRSTGLLIAQHILPCTVVLSTLYVLCTSAIGSVCEVSSSCGDTKLWLYTHAGENEGNVRWALDKWPQLQLVEQTPMLGGPGLTGQRLLTADEAALVQRFDPGGGEDDTMGFFIAKLVKRDHTRT
jgi:hypothetical protein